MLADQIQTDLTAAMKARDQLRVSVLRMALAAVKEARVSGDEVRDLGDADVQALLAKEAKRREEAAAAFDEGCLLYTSPSPRDLSTSRMPSSA